MGKFEAGDSIKNKFGETATVIDSKEMVLLQWDSNATLGTWDAKLFELVTRSYKPGDYVRIVETGVVGMVFDDDGDPENEEPFWVAAFDSEGVEDPYSADELIPWHPAAGERVLEVGVEDETEGTIVFASNGNASVLWDGFPHPQDFAVAHLEPVDEIEDKDEDDFEIGEVVTFSNPFLSGERNAKVVGHVNENVIAVAFEPGTDIADGYYSKDFFSKAA